MLCAEPRHALLAWHAVRRSAGVDRAAHLGGSGRDVPLGRARACPGRRQHGRPGQHAAGACAAAPAHQDCRCVRASPHTHGGVDLAAKLGRAPTPPSPTHTPARLSAPCRCWMCPMCARALRVAGHLHAVCGAEPLFRGGRVGPGARAEGQEPRGGRGEGCGWRAGARAASAPHALWPLPALQLTLRSLAVVRAVCS